MHSLGLRSSQVLNAADPDCPAVLDIEAYVARAMNHDWRIIPLTGGQSAGATGDTRWTTGHPIVLDASRAISTGYIPASTYADAVPALVEAAINEVGQRDWRDVYPALAAYPADQFDYPAEDRLLR